MLGAGRGREGSYPGSQREHGTVNSSQISSFQKGEDI